MRYINGKRRIDLFRIISIAFWVVIITELPIACAQNQAGLQGNWAGSIMGDNAPIGIDLTIKEVKVNKEGGELHYGEPRGCRLTIVYTAVQESYYWFALKNSTGGYCDKLESGHLKLKLKDSGHLSFETTTRSSTELDSGDLEKQ